MKRHTKKTARRSPELITAAANERHAKVFFRRATGNDETGDGVTDKRALMTAFAKNKALLSKSGLVAWVICRREHFQK